MSRPEYIHQSSFIVERKSSTSGAQDVTQTVRLIKATHNGGPDDG